jgi:sugar phosphate isomerase/epimerase
MGLLSLAAGTIPESQPLECVDVAAAAGFDRVGVRIEPPVRPDAPLVRELRSRLDASPCALLDLEVVRLGVDETDEREYVDLAAALGAPYVLTISLDPDESATTARIAALATYGRAAGVRIIVEFMVFSAIPTLTSAMRIAESADADVLVDVLHLARSGGTPADVAAVDPARLPYLQVCDAPAAAPTTPTACLHEALHGRLMPGAGALPVREVVDAVAPDTVISVEIQSDDLFRLDPWARAARIAASARNFLAEPACP